MWILASLPFWFLGFVLLVLTIYGSALLMQEKKFDGGMAAAAMFLIALSGVVFVIAAKVAS
jgi:hypothetical protein